MEIDDRSEKMGLKIRNAEMQKVPYMLVIGDKEMENQSVALRKRKDGNKGVYTLEDMMSYFEKEI
jgi:threonyl-tRNA synthetase